MKCKPGQYYCNTDKVCKPMPSGFNVPGQNKKPTEVGLGKGVNSGECNGTPKGKSCPVHGLSQCSSVKEEIDPKGPVKAYKSPEELVKKHKVPMSHIQKQLDMGTKIEGEHTTSKKDARITASQHVDEDPNYYTNLKKVEKKKTNEEMKQDLVTTILKEIQESFNDEFFEGEVCQYCGCDPCECEDNSKYEDEDSLDESVRIPAKTGNIILCTVSWRGKYIGIKMFFPQSKRPNREEINNELQKVYPNSRVVSYKVSELGPGEPVVYVTENSKSEEYASRRHRFQSRHAKNIAKGKMSAAYWANKVKW